MLKLPDSLSTEMSQVNSDQKAGGDSSVKLNPDNNIQEVFSSSASRSLMSPSDLNSSSVDEQLYKRTFSWHEHVYRKLTTRPTPHYIENILGISKKTSGEQEPIVHKQVIDVDNFQVITNVPDLNEPLNLSIRSDLKVRMKNVKGKFPLFVTQLFGTNVVISDRKIPQTSSCLLRHPH